MLVSARKTKLSIDVKSVIYHQPMTEKQVEILKKVRLIPFSIRKATYCYDFLNICFESSCIWTLWLDNHTTLVFFYHYDYYEFDRYIINFNVTVLSLFSGHTKLVFTSNNFKVNIRHLGKLGSLRQADRRKIFFKEVLIDCGNNNSFMSVLYFLKVSDGIR